MLAVQCKMARAALGLGVRELALAAAVSPETVVRFEGGETLRPRTIAAMRTALETAGVEFIAENGGGPGVRLRNRKSLLQAVPTAPSLTEMADRQQAAMKQMVAVAIRIAELDRDTKVRKRRRPQSRTPQDV